METAIRYVSAVTLEEIVRRAPTRVIALMPHIADHLLASGLCPVGLVAEDDASSSFPEYLQNLLLNTTSVGHAKQPDLERIAELSPDLIIGEAKKHLPYMKALSAIAPTVLLKDLAQDWREIARFVARLSGSIEQLELELEAFDRELDSKRAMIAKLNIEGSSLFLNIWKEEGAQVYAAESHWGRVVYDKLGVQAPKLLNTDEKYKGHKSMYPYDLHELAMVDTNWIWVMGLTGSKQAAVYDQWHGSEAWKGIEAVTKGRVGILGALKDGNEGKGLLFYRTATDQLCNQFQKFKEEQRT